MTRSNKAGFVLLVLIIGIAVGVTKCKAPLHGPDLPQPSSSVTVAPLKTARQSAGQP